MDTAFAKFIRTATPTEKRRVYLKMIRDAIKRQKEAAKEKK